MKAALDDYRHALQLTTDEKLAERMRERITALSEQTGEPAVEAPTAAPALSGSAQAQPDTLQHEQRPSGSSQTRRED